MLARAHDSSPLRHFSRTDGSTKESHRVRAWDLFSGASSGQYARSADITESVLRLLAVARPVVRVYHEIEEIRNHGWPTARARVSSGLGGTVRNTRVNYRCTLHLRGKTTEPFSQGGIATRANDHSGINAITREAAFVD